MMMDCLSSNWIFYACFLLTAVLSLIPIVGKFLNVLNTLFHESGHAIMALLTGGGVMNIKLSADTSGAAQTKSKYWLGKVLTSLAGYPIAALTAWLFFWLIQQQMVNHIFYIIISLLLINLILWVRNTFGIIWLIVMGVLAAAFYIYANSIIQSYYGVFCASILLFQSIYSAFTLLIISVKSPNKAGDAKNLSTFTYIPSVIWALLFFSFALFVAYRVLFLLPCAKFILT
jgi:hypothetical protein